VEGKEPEVIEEVIWEDDCNQTGDCRVVVIKQTINGNEYLSDLRVLTEEPVAKISILRRRKRNEGG
jgi:hypothetical protein